MHKPLSWALALCLGAGALASGCASSGPNLSDADKVDRQRDGALAIFIKRKVTDELDVAQGDAVDWKYVDIPRAGVMRVAVAFDNPERIEGRVTLRDNFGTVLENFAIDGGNNLYTFAPVNATTGRYYVQLEAVSGASVYTVGVLFDEPDLSVSPIPDVAPSRPSNPGPSRPGPGPGPTPGPGPGPAPVVTPTTPDPVVDPPTNTAPPEPAGVSITGSIRRITPLEDGGALLTVYVGNNADKIASGTSGTINGLGAGVIVRSRNGAVVTVYTKVDADDLAPYKAVTFRVK